MVGSSGYRNEREASLKDTAFIYFSCNYARRILCRRLKQIVSATHFICKYERRTIQLYTAVFTKIRTFSLTTDEHLPMYRKNLLPPNSGPK